jgi:hypothetical protein
MLPLAEAVHKQRHKGEVFMPNWERPAGQTADETK